MKRNRVAVLAASFAVAFAGGFALAQDSYGNPDYGNPNPSYGSSDDDIRQTVARLAYISGDVSFARGDDPDDWQPADPNIPDDARRPGLDRRRPAGVAGPRRQRRPPGQCHRPRRPEPDRGYAAVLAFRGCRVLPDPTARRRRRLRGRHAQCRDHVRAHRRLPGRRSREWRHPPAGPARPRHRRLGRRPGSARRRRRDSHRGTGTAAVRHDRRLGARRVGPLGGRPRRALLERALLPVRVGRHRRRRRPRPPRKLAAGPQLRMVLDAGVGRRSAGSPTVPAAGCGRTRGDGPGSRRSRGAGRRTTTGAGSPGSRAGTGSPWRPASRSSPTARLWWPSSEEARASRCRWASGPTTSGGSRSRRAIRSFPGGAGRPST